VTNPDGPAPAASPFQALAGAARVFRNAVLFLGACALGCAAIGRFAPFPEVPGVYPKWRHFREHAAEYDTIFVGSSRFFHQIIPHQFDAEVAKAGIEVNSFNFAYDGMWPPETFYLLRQVLSLQPPRLKWVVFDLMDINSRLDERTEGTMRMAYWHDWRHTRMALRDVEETGWRGQQRRELLLGHAMLGLRQMLNLGRGGDALRSHLMPPSKPRKISWDGHEGWEVGPDEVLSGEALKRFTATVATLPDRLRPIPVRPVFRDALADLIAAVRAAGAEPIFVIAPTINPAENFTGVPGNASVWAFNNPAEYPALFDPDSHYDDWHLNEKGAIAFTGLLAQRFIERNKKHP
jgi:hypothetical protein